MSNHKVPTQFPWIVAGILVVHSIVAVFLFGVSTDRSANEAAQAANLAKAAESTPTATGMQHPLGRPDATPASDVSADSIAAVEAPPATPPRNLGKADNEHFEPRFPRRIPLQSELTNEPPAAEKPAAADIFAMTEKEAIAEDVSEESGEVPSAVAAARAAPVTAELLDQPAIASTEMKGSANRLRMIEKSEPMPIPQPRPVSASSSTAPAVTMPLQPINRITQPEPGIRALPTIPKVEPKLAPVSKLKARPVIEEAPAPPSKERKFRVVKPLN